MGICAYINIPLYSNMGILIFIVLVNMDIEYHIDYYTVLMAYRCFIDAPLMLWAQGPKGQCPRSCRRCENNWQVPHVRSTLCMHREHLASVYSPLIYIHIQCIIQHICIADTCSANIHICIMHICVEIIYVYIYIYIYIFIAI